MLVYNTTRKVTYNLIVWLYIMCDVINCISSSESRLCALILFRSPILYQLRLTGIALLCKWIMEERRGHTLEDRTRFLIICKKKKSNHIVLPSTRWGKRLVLMAPLSILYGIPPKRWERIAPHPQLQRFFLTVPEELRCHRCSGPDEWRVTEWHLWGRCVPLLLSLSMEEAGCARKNRH